MTFRRPAQFLERETLCWDLAMDGVGLKATPSIAKSQQSVSLSRNCAGLLKVKGRHDPCIVPRAVPVVEAAAAIAIFDMILGNTQTNRRK